MRVIKTVASPLRVSALDKPRISFLADVRRLARNHSHTTRYKTRLRIRNREREEVIESIVALWPEGEKTGDNLLRHFAGVTAFILLLGIFQFLIIDLMGRPEFAAYESLLANTLIVSRFAFVLMFFTRSGKGNIPVEVEGITKLLHEYRDIRLLGPCIEALNFTHRAERAMIVIALRELLPKYATADIPPLNEYQLNTLLRELETIAARRRGKGRFIAQDDVEFMVAIVSALEADAVRYSRIPGTEAARTLDNMEFVLTRLDTNAAKALETVTAADRANHLRVQEAAENAVLRLRGLREGT